MAVEDPDYSLSGPEKKGLYRAIFSRRDVRSHFVAGRDIPPEALARILFAAHHAPSVGFSQPWNFILVKDPETRKRVHDSFLKERERSVAMLDGDAERQEKYRRFKLEGIMESTLNICVTYDPRRFGPFVLGRTSIEETGVYSVCCAIQNLWLAARAEGIGVGWVSILDNDELAKIIQAPAHVKPVAYLCLGYTSGFQNKPDLEKAGWIPRLSLSDVICYEKWGEQGSGTDWSGLALAVNDVQSREDNI